MPLMTLKLPKVFLDTSAVFAGLLSATGGARQILRLAEIGHVSLYISKAVLRELEQIVRSKAPGQMANLALVLDAARVVIVGDADPAGLLSVTPHLDYAPDLIVAGAAQSSDCDYFVTLDRKHFLNNAALRAALHMPMGTPGDYLAWHRAQLPAVD